MAKPTPEQRNAPIVAVAQMAVLMASGQEERVSQMLQPLRKDKNTLYGLATTAVSILAGLAQDSQWVRDELAKYAALPT